MLGIALCAALGCGDFDGMSPASGSPDAPEIPPIEEALRHGQDPDVIPAEVVLNVTKITGASDDGRFVERWFSWELDAATVLGWETREAVHPHTGQVGMVAVCDHEDQCFDGPEVLAGLRRGDEMRRVIIKRGGGELGTLEQSYCAGPPSQCPGPWTRHIGGLVPDNKNHTICDVYAHPLTSNNPWPYAGIAHIDWLLSHGYQLPNLGWQGEGVNLTYTGNAATGCPGWGNARNFLEWVDPEAPENNYTGFSDWQYRWVPNGENFGYSSQLPTADVLLMTGTLDDPESTSDLNCPVPAWADYPHSILGCWNAWIIPTHWQLPSVDCFWEGKGNKYQGGCKYARTSGGVLTISPANINTRADLNNLNRTAFLSHVVAHELGHSLGFTHIFDGGQPKKSTFLNTVMSALYPATPSEIMTTLTNAEICELRGDGWTGMDSNGNCQTSANAREASGRRLYGSTEY